MCRWLPAKADLFLKSFASSQRDDTRQFSLSGTRQYLWWSLPGPTVATEQVFHAQVQSADRVRQES